MLTINQSLDLAASILLVGTSVVLCLVLLYFFVRLIDKWLKPLREIKPTEPIEANLPQVEAGTFASTQVKKKQKVEEDIPLPVPFKVSTSFDGERIGKLDK